MLTKKSHRNGWDFEYNHKLWGYGGAMVNDFEYNHKLYGAMVGLW
jgi:hypothetical protein